MDYNLYVVNQDDCPKIDNPIIKDECGSCNHYKGFEMYNGQPCIKCAYYFDFKENCQTSEK